MLTIVFLVMAVLVVVGAIAMSLRSGAEDVQKSGNNRTAIKSQQLDKAQAPTARASGGDD